MRNKTNPFQEQLRAKQTRHQSHERDLSSLSEAELGQELVKAQERLTEAKRREIAATRDAATETGSASRPLFAGKRNRRPWK